MRFFFENHTLDVDRRELRNAGELVDLEPQVFDLLVYLLKNRDRVVSKDDLIDGVWDGRIVSESTLTSRITAARKAVGDTGKEQRLIRTVSRKGIRFVGEARDSSKPRETNGPTHVALTQPPTVKHQIHFCTASDGVRIAFAKVGEGPPLLKAANWLNHLQYDWESPVWSHLLRELAAEHQLIRYDERGNGLPTGMWKTSHSKPSCATSRASSTPQGSIASPCSAYRRVALSPSPMRYGTPSG